MFQKLKRNLIVAATGIFVTASLTAGAFAASATATTHVNMRAGAGQQLPRCFRCRKGSDRYHQRQVRQLDQGHRRRQDRLRTQQVPDLRFRFHRHHGIYFYHHKHGKHHGICDLRSQCPLWSEHQLQGNHLHEQGTDCYQDRRFRQLGKDFRKRQDRLCIFQVPDHF